ncbi:hypothetical protein VB620_18330 [Nodularia harveyana UHCC-0300]|uniref:Uncharacterized protein n=1 Tax=Nodularia harveyana UHCC-0300 TaxID=2974287 RepID=A0ABU5UJN0_9CYAN|nr:hypothetical protein [Nodularia harveyana]MEA5583290.1 hypothetical protein [Nodularia harveyana UHCC-0300]
MKYKIYGFIPVLILGMNLLLGCQVLATGSNNLAQNEKLPGNINQQLFDKGQAINQSVEELKESIKVFNDELKLVSKEDKNINKANSKNIRQKIDKLEKQLDSLPQNEKITNIQNNITLIITEIDKVILPLEKGLTSEGVSQVQKSLGFFTKRKISENFYGQFGETTQKEIEEFASKQSQELDIEIKLLQQSINQQSVLNNSIVRPNKFKPAANTNANNSDSELQLADIKSSLNKLRLTLTIGGLILLIGLIFCIYRIITLVEEQRRIIGLVKNNQKTIDINNIQIEQNEFYKILKSFDERLKQLEQNIKNQDAARFSSTYSNVTNIQPNTKETIYPQNPVISYSSSPASISNSDNQLVSTYNLNSRSLSGKATTVSESEYTAEQRHLGRSIAPILELNNRGNYWIIKQDNDEYLVPKGSIKINEHNYYTISTFFECLGYSAVSQNNFTLVKPAKVSSKGEQWQLIEIGQLQF